MKMKGGKGFIIYNLIQKPIAIKKGVFMLIIPLFIILYFYLGSLSKSLDEIKKSIDELNPNKKETPDN